MQHVVRILGATLVVVWEDCKSAHVHTLVSRYARNFRRVRSSPQLLAKMVSVGTMHYKSTASIACILACEGQRAIEFKKTRHLLLYRLLTLVKYRNVYDGIV